MQNASRQQNRKKKHETKKQTQMRAGVTVVDDGGDAHRAPQGVILAVRGQFLKTFRTKNTVLKRTSNVVSLLISAIID